MHRLVVPLLVLLLTGAWITTAGRGVPGDGTPRAGSPPAASPLVGQATPESRADAKPAVRTVVRDAAARLGIPEDDVVIERVEVRGWSDSSLGCPQPGMFYAQVITPGYLVVVSGAGRTLEYHTDSSGDSVVMCREI